MTATSITWLDPAFAVSPQLRPAELPRLKAAGFAAIVNNRPDHEEAGQPSSAALAEAARRIGLRYFAIPIEPGAESEEDARTLCRILDETAGPTLAFCRTGNRSASLWRRSRALVRDDG